MPFPWRTPSASGISDRRSPVPTLRASAARLTSWRAAFQRHAAMIPIVQQASCVVLIVRLGDTALASVRSTVKQVGRERILATISVGEAL